MKALIAVLVVALAPVHVHLAVPGVSVSVPAAALILTAEILAAAAGLWLAVRVIRRYRSRRWPRLLYGSAW